MVVRTSSRMPSSDPDFSAQVSWDRLDLIKPVLTRCVVAYPSDTISEDKRVDPPDMIGSDKRASERAAHGEILTAISEGLVALLKDYYGKGPTQAKTYYQDDLVVCLLRGGFTAVEQTLLDSGRGDAVIEQRMAFQDVMRQRFEAVVEQATGRRVIGFMSGNQQHPDMICEVFVLAPSTLFTNIADAPEFAEASER
jgi:uncharacterized protein YbcI